MRALIGRCAVPFVVAVVALGMTPVVSAAAQEDLSTTQAGSAPPVALVSVFTRENGRVTFDARMSFDPDGGDLADFFWEFGDGQSMTGPFSGVDHDYAPGTGSVTGRLTVTDPSGEQSSTSFGVAPFENSPRPDHRILSDRSQFDAGETIQLGVSGFDIEDGELPVQWAVYDTFCPTGDTCVSSMGNFSEVESFEVQVPVDFRLRRTVIVRAVDSSGMIVHHRFYPELRKAELRLTSSQAVQPTANGYPMGAVGLEMPVGSVVEVEFPPLAGFVFNGYADAPEDGPRRTVVIPEAGLKLEGRYLSEIDRRYGSEPRLAARMGEPKSAERADGDVRFRDYQYGRLYWSAANGVHEVRGAILGRYLAIGGHSALGAPTTDELATPDGIGAFNDFAGIDGSIASIYWTPPTGAKIVKGVIRQSWAATGYERGPIGYPTTDELTTPDGIGAFNHFTGDGQSPASIYWTPQTGAHDVRGLIRKRWADLGYERSYLGYPTSGEFAIPNGRRSNFQRGYIIFDGASGTVTDRPY